MQGRESCQRDQNIGRGRLAKPLLQLERTNFFHQSTPKLPLLPVLGADLKCATVVGQTVNYTDAVMEEEDDDFYAPDENVTPQIPPGGAPDTQGRSEVNLNPAPADGVKKEDELEEGEEEEEIVEEEESDSVNNNWFSTISRAGADHTSRT